MKNSILYPLPLYPS